MRSLPFNQLRPRVWLLQPMIQSSHRQLFFLLHVFFVWFNLLGNLHVRSFVFFLAFYFLASLGSWIGNFYLFFLAVGNQERTGGFEALSLLAGHLKKITEWTFLQFFLLHIFTQLRSLKALVRRGPLGLTSLVFKCDIPKHLFGFFYCSLFNLIWVVTFLLSIFR